MYNAFTMPEPKLYLVHKGPAKRHQVPNNLPAQLNPLIGREREVEEALRILKGESPEGGPEVRLLTLVGPGGVGKTSLAVRLAEEVLNGQFEHGVYFVELAPITDPELVLPAIAAVVQAREVPGTPLRTTLKEHLQDKSLLLILDNFEQVVTAGAAVAELLTACPGLKVLVTSRAALRVSAERVYAVSPLAMPEPIQAVKGRNARAEEVSRFGAVELFVQRASAVEPDFRLTDGNAESVAKICRKVDGLPLAIELVAAHARLLSPESIVARLTHPLRLLSGGAHDAVRHQTMRDTIEWSYELLDEAEQRLFRRLAVFAGGFSVRAAEAICNEADGIALEPDDPEALAVLERLEKLVDKSLVRRMERSEDGDRRLTMLETVREYALEQLEGSGEAEAQREKHADYYMMVAERAVVGMGETEKAKSLAKLAPDLENLRAVMHRLMKGSATEGSDDALRMLRTLHDFWQQHLHLSEFRAWFDMALAQAGPGATTLRAWSLQRAAALARWQGDFEKAAAMGEESLAMARELGDTLEIANALNALGGVALYQNDYETARARSEEALILYREAGADRDVYKTLGNLGLVATYQGDYKRAEEMLAECVRLQRAIGDNSTSRLALTNLGYAVHYQGDWRRAHDILLEILASDVQTDSEKPSARVLAGLAGTILAEVGSGRAVGKRDLQRVETAARILGLAAAHRERGGGNFDPRVKAEFERNVAMAQERLGEEAFSAAWEEGQGLTLEEALAICSEQAAQEDRESKPAGRGRPRKRGADELTDRESDVAALVAKGMTNAEIASRLVLSVRTVESHVANAMQKLGVRTRTELVAWVVGGGGLPGAEERHGD